MAKICGERYWVFDQGFVANSTGTARMFEVKNYVFWLSSGAGEKSAGHINKKPTESECKLC